MTIKLNDKTLSAAGCTYQTQRHVSVNLDFFTALLLRGLGSAPNSMAVEFSSKAFCSIPHCTVVFLLLTNCSCGNHHCSFKSLYIEMRRLFHESFTKIKLIYILSVCTLEGDLGMCMSVTVGTVRVPSSFTAL